MPTFASSHLQKLSQTSRIMRTLFLSITGRMIYKWNRNIAFTYDDNHMPKTPMQVVIYLVHPGNHIYQEQNWNPNKHASASG